MSSIPLSLAVIRAIPFPVTVDQTYIVREVATLPFRISSCYTLQLLGYARYAKVYCFLAFLDSVALLNSIGLFFGLLTSYLP